MHCNPKYEGQKYLWMGLISFVIGAVFLLQMFDVIPAETWSYLWPTLLVVVGLKMMIMGGTCNDECCGSGECSEPMEMKMAKPMKPAAPKRKPAKRKK